MPYGKQDDADEDVEAHARDRSDSERSVLWPHAADGSSGLRERRASWPSQPSEDTHAPAFGSYQLLTPIGTTAYGRAFRARQLSQGREVTLHFLTRAGVGESAQGRDLPLAVAKCAQLSHANVIAIEEYGQHEDGTYYLVTEPLEGVSLADCLDDVCTLPLSRALSIAVQVGRALRAAHKLDIAHGALTPANVRLVMTEQGELARVVGFGSALFRNPASESPEPDARSDVFAIGELLFRMLAGRPPPVADGTVPLLSAWAAKPVPRALDELVARCLEPRAGHRLADLVALTRGLREIARRVDAGLRSEVDARISGREPFGDARISGRDGHVDARGSGREPYADARGPGRLSFEARASSRGVPGESRGSSRAPRVDPHGRAHADAQSPTREPYAAVYAAGRAAYVGVRDRAPFTSDNPAAPEHGPAFDSDPAGSGAESPIRYSGVAWIVLGLMLALAAVWLVWHASGRAPVPSDHVPPPAATHASPR